MASLMRIIGSSIGPALAAMYMQSYQYVVNIGTTQHYFPAAEAYNLVFLTAAILSIVCVGYIYKIQCFSQMPKPVT